MSSRSFISESSLWTAVMIGLSLFLAPSRAAEPAVLTTKDGRIQVTLPDGYSEKRPPRKEIQLKLVNEEEGTTIYILSEAQKNFDTLRAYAETVRDGMTSKLQDPQSDDGELLDLNGHPAIRFEMTGISEGLRVAFQVTIIQTETRFSQVIGSCLRAQYDDRKIQFAKAARTLKEVRAKPAENAPAAPKPDEHVPIVVGLQLHSLRVQMAKDVPATLAEVEKWGIADVELGAMFNLTPQQYRKELDAHHLHATGIHFPWHQLLTDLDGAVRDAKILGCDYITVAWIPHKGDFTAEDAKNACEKFNEWGKKCAEAGLHFTYHPHGYEFGPYQGGTIFDLMVASTRPQWVSFELDVFWAYFAGADPVKLLQKYPTRFSLLHLKDMDKSVKVPNDGPRQVGDSNVPLGTGQIDVAGILRESLKIGVKHYYIEDESSRSEEQVPKSAKFISDFRPQ